MRGGREVLVFRGGALLLRSCGRRIRSGPLSSPSVRLLAILGSDLGYFAMFESIECGISLGDIAEFGCFGSTVKDFGSIGSGFVFFGRCQESRHNVFGVRGKRSL